ncbi:transposase (plasmid) [Cylindrospermum sp. NIES-4074]|nr:transposase [Cylindrospermum sp. NIES-4074]
MQLVDGTVFDVPDTQENARVFGYPGTRPGTRAAFLEVRLVLLIEAGTHLIRPLAKKFCDIMGG